ncbi:HalOD1 output domain-containing protein [Natrononativus amylolyticus]|uniref:HalOD1 output domain-containing protein n=1 Tax=Natrononativus amylolyticus TaxID=2963434 RepID=UPI0020CF4E59|nr:HalOD1 output domain-containing protein [Natrononativus amylolyticus]
MTPDTANPSLEYDPGTGSYVLHPPMTESVSVDIISAVARISGIDPLEMTPLYSQTDPELIEALYAARCDESIEIDGPIEITVADCRVSIERDGSLLIEPTQ